MILLKKNFVNILDFSLVCLFVTAGFSQIQISIFKPGDFIIPFVFLIFILKGKSKIGLIYIFFFICFFYAWTIGNFESIRTFLSSTILFFLIFSMINYFRNEGKNKIEYFLKLFLLSMFLSNFISLLIFIFFPSYKELVMDNSMAGIRLKGFFNQANAYAFVLIINLPIAIYFLQKNRNFYNIINTGIIAVCLFLIQSRGAFLSLFIGFFFLYFLYLLKSKKIHKVFVPLLITFGSAYILFTFLPQLVENQLGINLERLNPAVERDYNRRLTDVSLSNIGDDRSSLLNAGIETAMINPFGLGYQQQHLVIGNLTGIYKIPHNYFVTLVLTYGILFGIIWLLIIFNIITKGVLKVYKNSINPSNLFFYLTALILSITLFYLTHSPEWSYFYFILSIYVALLTTQPICNSKNNTNISDFK